MSAAAVRCSSGSIGARACQARTCGPAPSISRCGISSPVALARPKRQLLSSSTSSHSMVTARRVLAPAPTTFSASSRSMPPAPPRAARLVDQRLARAASPRAPRTSRRRAARPARRRSPAPGSTSGQSAAGIGGGERGLHRDREHVRRELVDVDRLDEHPRADPPRPSAAAARRARRPSRPSTTRERRRHAATARRGAARSSVQRDGSGASSRRISVEQEAAVGVAERVRRQGPNCPASSGPTMSVGRREASGISIGGGRSLEQRLQLLDRSHPRAGVDCTAGRRSRSAARRRRADACGAAGRSLRRRARGAADRRSPAAAAIRALSCAEGRDRQQPPRRAPSRARA